MDFKTIKIEERENRVVVTILEKRIYLGITDIFREEMLAVLENKLNELIINLENVAVMNSAGLGVLIMARDKIKKDDHEAVEKKIKALKEIIESESKEDLEAKTKDLSESLQKVGAAMYETQQKTEQAKKPKSGKKDKKEKGESADKASAEEGEVVED